MAAQPLTIVEILALLQTGEEELLPREHALRTIWVLDPNKDPDTSDEIALLAEIQRRAENQRRIPEYRHEAQCRLVDDPGFQRFVSWYRARFDLVPSALLVDKFVRALVVRLSRSREEIGDLLPETAVRLYEGQIDWDTAISEPSDDFPVFKATPRTPEEPFEPIPLEEREPVFPLRRTPDHEIEPLTPAPAEPLLPLNAKAKVTQAEESPQTRLVAHLDVAPPFISLDGKLCPPFSETATCYVAALIKANGNRKSFSEFLRENPRFEGAVSSREMNKIPAAITQFIERDGKGCIPRLKVELLREAQ
jgi:hypothetical protein